MGLDDQDYPLLVTDASGDDSPGTVFNNGALRVSFDFSKLNGTAQVQTVTLDAFPSLGGQPIPLGTYNTSTVTNALINLDPNTPVFPGLSASDPGGQYLVRAVAQLTDGRTISSALQLLTVLTSTLQTGTYQQGQSVLDLLGCQRGRLGLSRSGRHRDSVDHQRVARGCREPRRRAPEAVQPELGHAAEPGHLPRQRLRLHPVRGRARIYFQGIDRIKLKAGVTSGYVDLQVHPTDEYFPDQWNLAVTDVPDAWRFTTGSGSVLLVSMDTALPAKVAGDSDLDAGQVNTELLPKDSSGNPVYLRRRPTRPGPLDNDGEPIVNLTNGSISPVSLSKSPQLLIGAGSNLVDTNGAAIVGMLTGILADNPDGSLKTRPWTFGGVTYMVPVDANNQQIYVATTGFPLVVDSVGDITDSRGTTLRSLNKDFNITTFVPIQFDPTTDCLRDIGGNRLRNIAGAPIMPNYHGNASLSLMVATANNATSLPARRRGYRRDQLDQYRAGRANGIRASG